MYYYTYLRRAVCMINGQLAEAWVTEYTPCLAQEFDNNERRLVQIIYPLARPFFIKIAWSSNYAIYKAIEGPGSYYSNVIIAVVFSLALWRYERGMKALGEVLKRTLGSALNTARKDIQTDRARRELSNPIANPLIQGISSLPGPARPLA